MVKLDTYIAELLLENDCVIIPDFGGFVGNYQPARINPVNHRFDPPSKKISFNKLLVHNDGLLNAWVSKQLGESYPTANNMIRDYVVYLKKELQTNERVRIEKVGLLYKSNSGQLQFEQARGVNFLLDATGLKSFYSQPVEKEQREQKTIATEPVAPVQKKPAPALSKADEKKAEPVDKPVTAPKIIALGKEEDKRELNWLKIAAAVLLVPVAGYAAYLAFMTPAFKEEGHFHYSNLNPFTEKICTEYAERKETHSELPELKQGISIIHGEEFMVLLKEDESASLTVKLKDPEPVEAVTTSVASAETLRDQRMRYHIIGGCFGEEGNAVGLVEKFRAKGANAAILDKSGSLYRVAVKSVATREEALDALEEVRKSIPGAWLVVK